MSLLEKSITLEQVLNIFLNIYLNEEEKKLVKEYLYDTPNLLSQLIFFLENKEDINKAKLFIDKLLTVVAYDNYTLEPAYLDEGVLQPIIINITPYGINHLKVRYLRSIEFNEVEEKIFDLPQKHIGSSFSEPYLLSIKKD